MRVDPPGSPTADPSEDDGMLFEGLERAVEQARSKIPDHDNAPDIQFPLLPTQSFEPTHLESQTPAPFDSSAVMEVLRGAIDRYTNGDGHEQGAWVEELAVARDNAPPPGEARALATTYAPDRRRLAAVVVVLFLLVGGLALSQLGSGSSNKVTTNTVSTVQGQAVTTATLPTTTSAPPTTEAPTTEAPAAPTGTVKAATTTTVRRTTTTPTTAPDPCATPNYLPPQGETTTTEPPTTEPPTTEPPTTEPPTTDPCAAAAN